MTLEALTSSLADREAEEGMERWEPSPAGAGLLAEERQAQQLPLGSDLSYASLRKWEGELQWGLPGVASELAARLPRGGVDALSRSSADLPGRVTRAIPAWQGQRLPLGATEKIAKAANP